MCKVTEMHMAKLQEVDCWIVNTDLLNNGAMLDDAISTGSTAVLETVEISPAKQNKLPWIT